MPISPDRAEFFVREAGEYLARMTPLLATNALSSPDELVRLARALRGATLMAGPPGLIRATTAFENAAKALQGGGLSWGEPIITDVRKARTRLDTLVSRASAWGEEERKEASGLAQVLEELLGASDTTSPVRSSPVPPLESTPEGVRTFVMREAARIARSVEDLLATAARPSPEALRGVLDRMHAIRGLALPGHFHALTLVLESLESLLGDLLRGYPPPPDLGPILTTATLGLLRGAEGPPGEALPADVARLGELVCAAFAEERDVVPVEQLLLDPVPPAAREESDAPLPPPDPVDLVSLGDRLRHLASQFRTPDRAVLPFHVQSLAAMLRSLRTIADRAPAGPAVREIARAIRRGGALADPEGFASALLALAQPLTAATSITTEDLERDLALAVTLLPGGTAEAPPAPPAPPEIPASAPPAAAVAPLTEKSAATLPQGEEPDIVPIATLLLPADPAARTSFEVSFATLHRLRHGMDLVTTPGNFEAPVVPVDHSPRDEGIVPIEELLHRDEGVVPIEDLLYRGMAAAARLREIQTTLRTLRTPSPDPEVLSSLVDECLDLLPLALDVAH